MFVKCLVGCLFAATSATGLAAEPQAVDTAKDGTQTLNGLITPLDQEGKNFYLQHQHGQTEVLLTPDVQIGLLFREKNILEMLQARKISMKEVDKTYDLPKDIYVKVRFKDFKTAQRAVQSGELEAGILHATPLPDHLPTAEEPWFSGQVTEFELDHITPLKIVNVGGRKFKVKTSGYNFHEQIVGLLDASDIRPFVNQASLYGRLKGTVFHASEVLLRPIPDQTATDDPKLPRYLFIGDSISGNYGQALRDAVAGKLNIHHPPTNCGSSDKGRSRLQIWLGDYKAPGRHWDVISFNFGHWDAGNSKADYQANLESIVEQLKQTGARLIWVTTCPVPNGYPPAGELNADGKAPGRKAGVMQKYLNPWAAEVIARHPEISVCDQWHFVKDHEHNIYKDFWRREDVHFPRKEEKEPLGQFLADQVLMVINVKPRDGGR